MGLLVILEWVVKEDKESKSLPFWFLVYTKPRQEEIALENLERQGYECYLPMIRTEKLRRRQLQTVEEPLFPRYLFIRLGLDVQGKSWIPIRSTTGVSQLVRFGVEPAKVDEALIGVLRAQARAVLEQPKTMFNEGERLRVMAGPFHGLEGVYQMSDGYERVKVLIEFMSRQRTLSLPVVNLRRA